MKNDFNPIWVREKFLVMRLGLSRTVLRSMRDYSLIVSVSLRSRSCKQGTLLYRMSSVVEYMESLQDSHGKRFIEAKALAGFRNTGLLEELPVMGTAKFIAEKLGLTRSILRRLREEKQVVPVPVTTTLARNRTLLYSTGFLMDLLDGLAAEQMAETRQKRSNMFPES